MSRIRALLLAACALTSQLFLSMSSSAQGIPQNIPRKELLILENPEGTIKNAGWFNIWAINAGSQSNGLQQSALDTLWYIDPESGLDGVWDNSLASDKPQYNADFTEMTAKLRKGIYWSDGVEFTADDVIATVMTQIKNPGMRFSAVLASNVAILTRWCSSSRSRTRASMPTSPCDGMRSGSCPSIFSTRWKTRPNSISTSRFRSVPMC
jgi:peptide/nickel transport system substrate-binding protein